tara:strand:+ start:96 stop:452 length:357 start_codon:yes stop_codon:yes gene_type:complete
MYIKCKGLCYLCKNPLKPYIKSESSDEKIIIRKYKKIKPLFLTNNETYYKYIKSKMRRTCYSCFKFYRKPSIEELRLRECGMLNMNRKTLSISSDELFYWFENLKKYALKCQNGTELI